MGHDHDAGNDLKIRMRADLRAAMKERRTEEAKLIRTLIAAIDNAEAPPPQAGSKPADQHPFRDGTAEVERLAMSAAEVHAILAAEIREREEAAAEMSRLGKPDRADMLNAEVLLARRYLV